jgi:putative ABC transport system permease protein
MALPISYNVKSLRVRWQVTLLAVIGIALVVAVFVVLAALAAGFQYALRATGRPDNAIVVQKGSTSEITSGIRRDNANFIAVDNRVARDAKGQPLASPEIALVAALPRLADGVNMNVMLRGVTPRAFEVRGGIKLIEGRSFTPGLYELIVGTHVRDRYGLSIGKTLKLQRQTWTVVGIFESSGSGFENEIWGDADVFGPAFNRTGGYQVLVVRLADPTSLDAFARSIATNPNMQLELKPEIDFYDGQAGPTLSAITGLTWFVSLIMAIGAVVGAMNTMYAIVSARTREIGTLRALGFSRLSILVSFVLESLVLALVAGLLGCLIALPANGISAAGGGTTFTDFAYAFRVTPGAIGVGLIFALIMGFLGGLLPAFRAARLPITTALREA